MKRGREGGQVLRDLRPILVATVATLLFLLPGAALVASASQSVHTSAAGGNSDLNAAWDKPVDFVETGLPSGTAWSVNLSGTLGTSDTPTVAFMEIPGVYPFVVTPVPGYVASPSAGNVTVTSCMGVTVEITFTPVSQQSTYAVDFTETGLANDTAWWVAFDGANTTSTSATIAFSVPNGTYAFLDPAVVSGATGTQYVTLVSNGTVSVSGAAESVTIPYATEYYLTTNASPAAGGNVTPSAGWYPAGASVVLSAIPAPGYDLLLWDGIGDGSYSGTNASPTVTMNSPISETADFGLAYGVVFEETGLLDGVTWGITFNGVSQSAYFVFLDFSAPNGTYQYNVTPIPGYHTTSYQGTVIVAGANVTVLIPWVRLTYNVTFVESGLPADTSWSVTLNGSQQNSESPSILFLESNYTYLWTVAPVSGYSANDTGGSLVVDGTAVWVYIGWTANTAPLATYTVTFVESGLATNTAWSVGLNGTHSTSLGSTESTIVFADVSNGTYSYWVPTIGTFQTDAPHGTVVVAGANVTVPVDFLAPITPSAHSTSIPISIWDLLVLALVSAGGVVITYLSFRRK